ncbi:MAG: Fe-S cluster assembly transcriptional regulator IscR [Pseudomonadales bacterium]|jgi:Rrf2 family iron-sulfur cluster assembly transcriptional regulator|uniref:BadM/Rrf2 family transcriptional regulator n=1 Tax=Umboniibacter marinipuniceus TaxID=569599 RepID=A0A3M0A2A0_9GAMM|nr:Fe-S cluster assembly transcriptional regulator IscR [Umboniibacter marinipuniceus]RMA78776.1 BadM/Rrf2 family transcriptional regulator [Umboniibacter marinipuniceus]
MRLTTKGRYAVTALLDLAINQSNGTISLADISTRQEISLSYLEQLFSKLRRRGLVTSVRGPGGGYRLAVDTNDINIADIVDAVDESIDATNCNGRGNCHEGSMCLTHHLWMDLSVQIRDFLKSISLAALIEREEIRRISVQQQQLQASGKIPLTAI